MKMASLRRDVALQRLCGGAERFRRASTPDELNGGDRRTAYAGNEAKRARDMRKYPFWARWLDCVGLCQSLAQKDTAR